MQSLLYALLAAGLTPYLFTTLAKVGAFRLADNARTRAWQEGLTGWRQRAHWAQLNAFEAFPFFAAAVLSVMLLVPSLRHPRDVAWAFVGLRLLYGACYVGNWPRLRSTLWFASMLCVLALFSMAIHAAGSHQ